MSVSKDKGEIMKRKTSTEVIDEIESLIEQGLDIEGLKKARRRLYRLKDDSLSIHNCYRKYRTLGYIKDIIRDDIL